MARVTSKLQLTIPKALAEQFGIRPGDELDCLPAGEAIRLIPPHRKKARLTARERVKLFDQATLRQRKREASRSKGREPADRGWKREDLYTRGFPR